MHKSIFKMTILGDVAILKGSWRHRLSEFDCEILFIDNLAVMGSGWLVLFAVFLVLYVSQI